MDVDVEQIVRTYLKDVIVLSLATSRGNQPWVCEVIFAYDDELNLYFRSLTRRRHSQEIAANPNVAGIIARPFRYGEYPHGVYFEGTAKLLEPGGEQQKSVPSYARPLAPARQNHRSPGPQRQPVLQNHRPRMAGVHKSQRRQFPRRDIHAALG